MNLDHIYQYFYIYVGYKSKGNKLPAVQKADLGSQYNRLENAILFCSVGEKNKDRLVPTLLSRLDGKFQFYTPPAQFRSRSSHCHGRSYVKLVILLLLLLLSLLQYKTDLNIQYLLCLTVHKLQTRVEFEAGHQRHTQGNRPHFTYLYKVKTYLVLVLVQQYSVLCVVSYSFLFIVLWKFELVA